MNKKQHFCINCSSLCCFLWAVYCSEPEFWNRKQHFSVSSSSLCCFLWAIVLDRKKQHFSVFFLVCVVFFELSTVLDLKLQQKTTFLCKLFKFMLFSLSCLLFRTWIWNEKQHFSVSYSILCCSYCFVVDLKLEQTKTTFLCKFFQFSVSHLLFWTWSSSNKKQHFSVSSSSLCCFLWAMYCSDSGVGTKNNIFL